MHFSPTTAPDTALQRWFVAPLPLYVTLAMLPVCLLLGAPWQAWAVAASFWLVNRLLHIVVLRSIDGLPQTMAVGAAGLTMMFRVWGIAFVLFMIGARFEFGDTTIGWGREDIALPAMVMFLIIVTVDIGTRALGELRRYRGADPATDGVVTADGEEAS